MRKLYVDNRVTIANIKSTLYICDVNIKLNITFHYQSERFNIFEIEKSI